MAPSISGSKKRSYSPPLPPSPPPKLPRPDPLSSPEEPLPGFPSQLPRSIFEEKSKKRRRIEEQRDKSLLYGFQLQPYAAKILQSNDISPLQEAIKDYIESKELLPARVFESFAIHYPNAFSLKLAKVIEVHPPLLIRIEAVSLLHHIFSGNSKINSSILIELKKPLLHSIKVESEETLLPPLCETICLVAARLYDYPLGGWEEFLQYVCDCFSDESNEMKGLMLVAEMPLEVCQNREFWLGKGNYDLLFTSILNLGLLGLPDHKLQSLMFDASITVMGMSMHLGRAVNIGDNLIPILLKFIDQLGEKEVMANNEIVLSKLRRLAELISLGVPEIFEAKEDDVFWCMIRVAEVKRASEEVKVAAVIVLSKLDELRMDVMENFLYYLSPDEIKRVVAVALDMMRYIVEDPLWYEMDNKDCMDAGMTEAYDRGKFLLDWLSFQGTEGVVVPTIIEMITIRSSTHIDWRVRHAAMLAIGTIGGRVFQGDMVEYFDQVVNLVLKSLNDENHRVLWATMHSIKCLSGYKQLLMRAQYHAQLIAKLVPIVNTTLCARVQSYAITAIRLLITKCGVDELPFVEEIVTIMLVLLKHEKQKIQEEALETLKSIALLSPIPYRQHYFDTTMKALKDIVMANYTTPSPKLYFLAKCLDCMSNLVRKVDPDKFEGEEVVEVIGSLVTLEGNLNYTDYITRALILKALDQFCQCPRVDVGIFMNKMMPMLLRFAQLDVDLTANMPADDSLDGAKHLVESVRVRACNILSYCAVRSPLNFSPCISKVSKLFARWVGCSSFDTRKASILALPNLLLSIKMAVQKEQTQRFLTTIIVESLVEGIRKETYGDLSTEMLRILSTCIKTSSSFFTSQLIKIIADEINRIVGKVIAIEIVKAKEARTSEGGRRYLPNREIIQDANNLVEVTLETFSSEFLPYVDALMSNVATFWVHDIPDKVVAYIISVFNIIVPRFPEKLPKYHNKYISTACDALREDRPYCQLRATRAIGIGAKFGGHGFKTFVTEAITRLHDFLTIRLSSYGLSGGVAMLRDAAVAALGKILEFHRGSINGSKELVRNWLNFLPLKHDFSEAIYVHGLLSTMLKRSDKDLFGPDNENLPKVISVVKEILSPPRLATEEDINQMIDFLNQHDGMDLEQSSSKDYMPTT